MCIPRRALVSILAAACGCGGEAGPTFSIRLHVPPSATADGQCPQSASFVPLSLGGSGPTSIRLTWRDPATHEILCDAVIPTDGSGGRLGVPLDAMGSAPVADLSVEAFRDDGGPAPVLLSSGEARAIDLAAAGGEIPVLLAPREQFACAAGRLVTPRAFHSVTPLPNGELLVVGGVVAIPGPEINLGSPAGGGFFASNGAEIYDPRRGTFRALPIADLIPRALHQAYLLPTAAGAPYEVLVLGGLTVAGDARQVPILDGVRDMVEPLRLVPSSQAQGALGEVITYDPVTGTASRRAVEGPPLTPRLLGSLSRAPTPYDVVPQTPPLAVGGWRTYSSQFENTFEVLDPATASRLGPITPLMPGVARIGATVTHLEMDRALVLGGNLSSAGMAEVTEVGHVLSGLSTGSPGVTQLTVDPVAAPAPRAFHTAVPIGPNRVLVTGGFVVAAGTAIDPSIPFAYLLRVDPATTQAMVTGIPYNADITGYADATPILGGDVIITGGSPATAFACPGEPMASYLCALKDAHRFVNATDTIIPIPPMIVPRWGHRLALLGDGTVIVTGGLRYDGGLFVVADAELWNPRTEAFDPAADDPALAGGMMLRAPGDIARNLDGTPARACFVE